MDNTNILNRILIVAAGLGLAWCAVWGAGEMRAVAVAHGPRDIVTIAFIVVGIAAFALGALVLTVFATAWERETEPFREVGEGTMAFVNAICFAFIFGALVAPVGQGGLAVWVTPWDFLLIAGFLPALFFVKDLLGDIVRSLVGALGKAVAKKSD